MQRVVGHLSGIRSGRDSPRASGNGLVFQKGGGNYKMQQGYKAISDSKAQTKGRKGPEKENGKISY